MTRQEVGKSVEGGDFTNRQTGRDFVGHTQNPTWTSVLSSSNQSRIRMKGFKQGEIILQDGGKHPDESLAVDGFDGEGNLLAHPLGGGFQISIPADSVPRFSAVQVEEAVSVFSSALFAMDGVDGEFQGWCDGMSWNGWEKPCFTRDVAEAVLRAVGAVFTYSQDEDAFIMEDAEGEETERFEGIAVELGDGGSVIAYFIGAGSWIWEKIE